MGGLSRRMRKQASRELTSEVLSKIAVLELRRNLMLQPANHGTARSRNCNAALFRLMELRSARQLSGAFQGSAVAAV